jgi:hypothetical protein
MTILSEYLDNLQLELFEITKIRSQIVNKKNSMWKNCRQQKCVGKYKGDAFRLCYYNCKIPSEKWALEQYKRIAKVYCPKSKNPERCVKSISSNIRAYEKSVVYFPQWRDKLIQKMKKKAAKGK